MCKDIANAFQVLLSDPGEWRANLEGMKFSRINELGAFRLELSVSEEEVYAAMNGMNRDKALGSGGFTTALWQFSWEIVKEDVMRVFREFHESGKFVRSLNTTFLVMIPKKKKGGGGGVLAHVTLGQLVLWEASTNFQLKSPLANRLKGVITELVNKAQNAFIGGRLIMDASLIANEVIDSMVKKKEKGLLCKLDIEKAYDNINWKFLFRVLQEMGFRRKWVK